MFIHSDYAMHGRKPSWQRVAPMLPVRFRRPSSSLHHHMCAVSTPELEKKFTVPNSTSTLCAVCANVLTLDQVTLIQTDQAAAKHTSEPNVLKPVLGVADVPSIEVPASRMDVGTKPAAAIEGTEVVGQPNLQAGASAAPTSTDLLLYQRRM
eukprot:3424407-Pleurochrysis_carterae.AAC.3